jgi:hypothetical protein
LFIAVGAALIIAIVVFFAYRASLDDPRVSAGDSSQDVSGPQTVIDTEKGGKAIAGTVPVQAPWHLSVDTSGLKGQYPGETCYASISWESNSEEIISYSSYGDFQLNVKYSGTFHFYGSGYGCKFAVIGPDGEQVPIPIAIR